MVDRYFKVGILGSSFSPSPTYIQVRKVNWVGSSRHGVKGEIALTFKEIGHVISFYSEYKPPCWQGELLTWEIRWGSQDAFLPNCGFSPSKSFHTYIMFKTGYSWCNKVNSLESALNCAWIAILTYTVQGQKETERNQYYIRIAARSEPALGLRRKRMSTFPNIWITTERYYKLKIIFLLDLKILFDTFCCVYCCFWDDVMTGTKY